MMEERLVFLIDFSSKILSASDMVNEHLRLISR
jgi:hypothetical protein